MTTKLFSTVRRLLALSLCWTALSAQAEEVQLDRMVAVVDNDVIMASELDRRTEVVREQLRQRGTRLPPEDALRRQVLDKLILDRLQLQQAEQNGLAITEQALDSTLERIAASNGLSLPAFKAELEASGQNYREVREQIRSEMLITQVRERLVNRRIQISDQEVESFLASEQGREQALPDVRLSHIMLPLPREAGPEAVEAVEARAMRTYRELEAGADFAETAVAVSKAANALEGGDLGWRNLAELPETVAEAAKELKPGEITRPVRMGGGFHILKLVDRRGGAVRLVEQTKARHILISPSEIRTDAQARQLAQDLHRRLQAGEEFAALAKEFSDDVGSGSIGGDLGWILPGQMVPAFEAQLAQTAVGELSEPFKSRFGWHILEVQDKREKDLGEDLLANEAREAIRKRKFAEELNNWLNELRSQAYLELKL
ncbi:peptidylprolyl isomerase [Motiliproteus sp. SC1-56]|uniref:peptidylprolyl isomerase n=1 Tax=Motiliproteus sp. SC1-56 TaxID=2799565 RepID=UPI001A8F7E65|nr:peptidylprolyl isomerase [Motiliproteus sp. SC1-56]